MKLITVRIKSDDEGMIEYSPDRILGTEEKLAKLDMEVLGQPSTDSVMWTYENTDVLIPAGKVYEVEIDQDGATEEYYCDMHFGEGVMFGYVDLRDWVILDTYYQI